MTNKQLTDVPSDRQRPVTPRMMALQAIYNQGALEGLLFATLLWILSLGAFRIAFELRPDWRPDWMTRPAPSQTTIPSPAQPQGEAK